MTPKQRLWIKARNKERKARFGRVNKRIANGNGIYSTPYVDVPHCWTDIWFTGKYNLSNVVYATALQTVEYSYHSKVEDIAFEEQEELYPFVPFEFEKHGKNYRVTNSDPYNGEDREWRLNRIKEIMDSGDVTVQESVELRHEYYSAIGVWATINVGVLIPKTVIQFINDFKEHGPRDFKGDQEFSYTHDEIEKYFADLNKANK